MLPVGRDVGPHDGDLHDELGDALGRRRASPSPGIASAIDRRAELVADQRVDPLRQQPRARGHARGAPRPPPPAPARERSPPDGARWRRGTARGSTATPHADSSASVSRPGARDGAGRSTARARSMRSMNPRTRTSSGAGRRCRRRDLLDLAGPGRHEELEVAARRGAAPIAAATCDRGADAPWLPPNTDTVVRPLVEVERARAPRPGERRGSVSDLATISVGSGCRCARPGCPRGSRDAVASKVVATTRRPSRREPVHHPGHAVLLDQHDRRSARGGPPGSPGRSRIRRCRRPRRPTATMGRTARAAADATARARLRRAQRQPRSAPSRPSPA